MRISDWSSDVCSSDLASFVPQSQREAKFRRHGEPESARPTTENIKVAMKTFTAKNETVQRDWYVVDATGKTLGRLSAELAHRLRGKHKPGHTPNVAHGNSIVAINAQQNHGNGHKPADQTNYPFTR